MHNLVNHEEDLKESKSAHYFKVLLCFNLGLRKKE